MSEKIVVGPVSKGFRNDVIPAYIDNDSFPTLINAFQWRGRVKRKRGTSPLCRLTRYFASMQPYTAVSSFNLAGDSANLKIVFSLPDAISFSPGSIMFTALGQVFTDPGKDGILVGSLGGSGTINYVLGNITVTGGGASLVTLTSFNYYPNLPVMGLEDLNLNAAEFPQNLSFDTTYSYQIVTAFPYYSYDVSFYKNPPSDGTNLPGYVPKTFLTPVTWNGEDYQQFWTVNYENALWATNGITQPFSTTHINMQFKPIVTVTVLTVTTANLNIIAHNLVVGDFLFINEVVGTTGINFQSGYVTSVPDADHVIVTFPFANLVGNGTGGIAQYLTNTAIPGKDCLRWYDGSPSSGTQFNPTLTGKFGWVNFSPPLFSSNTPDVRVGDLPFAQYYLVGARMIYPYKDRILFIGCVVQTSGGPPIYLQDTIVYSQNGTPFYNSSFTGNPLLANVVPHTILAPNDQSATVTSYFSDATGFGGSITAGFAQPITYVAPNQDVLILGFSGRQIKLLYTSNDILPFEFYIINSELGATGTFSAIVLDRGVLSIGDRGIIQTDQQSCARIDLEIPDQVFQIDLLNNGTQRITAQRDFISEWVYFTYPFNNEQGDEEEIIPAFPNQTLFYNYRDGSWAIFNESYTTYGQFRKQTGFTWQTVGSVYASWEAWNEPWTNSESTLENPIVIAGNQQGFVVVRDQGTVSEAPSLYIRSFGAGNTVVSPNHGLNNGDFIYILDVLGTIGAIVNSSPVALPPSYKIFKIAVVDSDTFSIDSEDPVIGTYLGNGTITRLYVPQIQTKEFPPSWGLSRKTRIGVQQYLFTTTANAQITLQIFLSQSSASPFNFAPYVPDINADNNSVVFSDVLYTCIEGINLGLTPANINLQQIVPNQQRTWHRMNTSLIGDTVQVGFTLSDDQMYDSTLTNQVAEIELHGMILDVSPSSMLS